MNWKLTRRIAFIVVLIAFLAAFKVAGFVIDLFLVVCYVVPVFGFKIYNGMTKRNAKIQADAIVDAQEKRLHKPEEREDWFPQV